MQNYNAKFKSGKSVVWAALFFVLLFMFGLYYLGSSVQEDVSLNENVNLSNVSVAVEPVEINQEKLSDEVPEILKEFYESNNAKFAIPKEGRIGWQIRQGSFFEGHTLSGYKTEGSNLIENKLLLAKTFLESRGFFKDSFNSRIEEGRIIEGFRKKGEVCLLETFSNSQFLTCGNLD